MRRWLQDFYDNSAEATKLEDEVKELLLKRKFDALDFTKEADFDQLVPIFWR